MSKRIQQVNELIKRELGKILLRETDFSKNILVTITRVENSVDLKLARIYISCLPEKEIEKVFTVLNKQIYHLQQTMNKRLPMRPVPKIKFIKEKETKKAAEIEELLNKIKE